MYLYRRERRAGNEFFVEGAWKRTCLLENEASVRFLEGGGEQELQELLRNPRSRSYSTGEAALGGLGNGEEEEARKL